MQIDSRELNRRRLSFDVSDEGIEIAKAGPVGMDGASLPVRRPRAFEDLIAVMERPLLYYAASLYFVWLWAGLAYFGGAVIDLRYRIYRSKVDLLKEVKQVQLQVLELQASLKREGRQ